MSRSDPSYGVPLTRPAKEVDGASNMFEDFQRHMTDIRLLTVLTVRNYLSGLRTLFTWLEKKNVNFVAAALLDFKAETPTYPQDITQFFLEMAYHSSQRHAACNGYQAFLNFMEQKLNDNFQEFNIPPCLANGMKPNSYDEAMRIITKMSRQCRTWVRISNKTTAEKGAENAAREFADLKFRCDENFQMIAINAFLTCEYVLRLNERLTTGGGMESGSLLSPAWVSNYLMLRLILTGGGHMGVAIRNFTLRKFQQMAIRHGENNEQCFVVSCKNHKTPRLPANIFIENDQLRHMLQLWATKMRPRFFPSDYVPDPKDDLIEAF